MIPFVISPEFAAWLQYMGVDLTRLSLPEAKEWEKLYLETCAMYQAPLWRFM